MTKLLLPLLLALTFVTNVEASPERCYEKLTDGFTQDSRSFSVNLDDLNMRDYGRDYQAEAIFIIRALVKELGCSKKDLNFGKGIDGRSKHSCRQLVPGRNHTTVCYIETQLGYFFVSKDFLENANVTYARWD